MLNVAVVASDFGVGKNRFPLFLFDFDGRPIEGAQAQVAFWPVEGSTVTVKSTAPASYRRIVSEYTHTHADGTVETHDAGRSLYVVDAADFWAPGPWGAQVTAKLSSGETVTGSVAFEVKARTATPAIGEAAPATAHATAKDVADLSEIDSSMPPRPELHQTSIAEALQRGRPFIAVFASPSYCTSQLCGPVTDEATALYPAYHNDVEFIHVEPYDLALLRSENTFRTIAATAEWKLPSEPWTFIVDRSGRVAAKFEGLATKGEIEQALKVMLAA